MKYRKYLIFVMLLFIFSINKIYAETCYYQVSGQNSLKYDADTGKFKIDDSNGSDVKWYQFAKKGEKLKNFNNDFNDSATLFTVGTGINVKAIPSGTCPEVIVYRSFSNSEAVFGFTNGSEASTFANASKQLSRQRLFSGEEMMQVSSLNRSYITEDQYENNLIENKRVFSTTANPNANYNPSGIETSDRAMSCEELFDKGVIDLINEILKYPRYIVPIIILALGSLDLFKAVVAGKEDEMRKAQKTFIKRIIIGVCVFLVPALINAIMWLANIAWQGLGYSTCNL